ncbi:MAG: hypothetical protein N2Z22_02550, partial [Turneriella sp.]|nr:hypothetical protein [Turneriella sp.]
RQDIYVCPFVGIVSGKKIGCLLHPKGSPHPQIQLWPHPQNFSFYGESICLSYDCLVKERMLYRADFFLWAKKADPLFYSRLACDHTLHRALAKIAPPQDLTHFYSLLAWLYARYRVVTTSFEDIAGHVPESAAALSAFLADRIASSPYAGANKFPLFEKLLLRQLAPNSIPRHQQIRKILRQAF